MRSVILVLSIVYYVYTLPPKGCTSCMMVPVEKHPHSGSFGMEKVVDSRGCFTQTFKCHGNTELADTFIQFNQGSSGFLAHGPQQVKLECSNDGQWQYAENGKGTVVVESVACLST
ncbi:hypothetical protein OESDEN_02050 [Oesophagostomum dentatum]|uniref:C6 domain-containing protein n=1 Tax=Oesophagostomum dentatum TaxID=61180 RepID=A0A0B1TQ64_OESDE|nr:hypothetical protein OESDEN_02050 [Oesophagostomum dentatum]